MPMREDCRHYQSRTYTSGEVARFCVLDMAPDAPWRCPDNCPVYERRLADAGWTHGSLVEPAVEDEPTDVPAADAADLLENAEEIVERRGARGPRRGPRARAQGAAQVRQGRRVRLPPLVQAQGLRPAQVPVNSGGRRSKNAAHRLGEVVRAQLAGVPGSDVAQPGVDLLAMDLGEHRLGALHGDRRVGGDLGCDRPGAGERRVGVGEDFVHEADPLGTSGVDVLAGERELGDVAHPDQEREALEAAEIGDDRHLRLTDREDRVCGADAEVAGGDEVDAAADAVAVRRGDDGLGALGRRR